MIDTLSRSETPLVCLARTDLRGILSSRINNDRIGKILLGVALRKDMRMVCLRGKNFSAWVLFARGLGGDIRMKPSKRVIIGKNSAWLMMEGVWMFLELEVCLRVHMLVICLMTKLLFVILRDLLADFRIL